MGWQRQPISPISARAEAGFQSAELVFRKAELDFQAVGLDFREAGLVFRKAGLDFRKAGADFRKAGFAGEGHRREFARVSCVQRAPRRGNELPAQGK